MTCAGQGIGPWPQRFAMSRQKQFVGGGARMSVVTDPDSGLQFYELSHPWGMYTPIHPGYEEIKLERITHHAKQGVMTHRIVTIFHTSTHVNAPIHLIPGA